MKALVIADIYFACLELCRAFKAISPSSAIFQIAPKRAIDVKSFEDSLNSERPDFVFTANMHGLFDLGDAILDSMEKKGIPIAVWFLDNPAILLGTKKNVLRKNMVSFTWDGCYLDELKKLGFEHVFKLPLATDPEIFYPKADIKDDFLSPLSFVGSSGTPLMNYIRGEKLYWSETTEAIERFIENGILNGELKSFDDGLSKLKISLDEVSRIYLEAYVILSLTYRYRREHLEALDEFFPVKIYGDNGWNGLTGYVGRAVDYVYELNSVYNGSAVNISLRNIQMKTGLNQRIYDVSASGSFLLTDFTDDLPELFEVEKEVICFCSKDEMVEKAKFYLENPDLRAEIGERARKRVLKEHTYINRASFIFKTMKAFV